jgi:hypothetical protein
LLEGERKIAASLVITLNLDRYPIPTEFAPGLYEGDAARGGNQVFGAAARQRTPRFVQAKLLSGL